MKHHQNKINKKDRIYKLKGKMREDHHCFKNKFKSNNITNKINRT